MGVERLAVCKENGWIITARYTTCNEVLIKVAMDAKIPVCKDIHVGLWIHFRWARRYLRHSLYYVYKGIRSS